MGESRGTIQGRAQGKETVKTIRDIQLAVSKRTGVTVGNLRGGKRTKLISFVRHVAMHMIKKHTRASLAEIGEHFGGRDHSTVLYSCNKINELIKTDEEVVQLIESIVTDLERKNEHHDRRG